jgi:NAD(P)-dependent dehydrogenase (short-subunit alcohol dehydrogenase family)
VPERGIIVTGGAGGLGRAHALAAAELDAHVYLADIMDAGPVSAEVNRAGGSASAHRLDVTDSAAWEDLAAFISSDGRSIVGLVNNAGVSFRRGFAGTRPEDWRRVIEVNLTGAFLGIRAIAPMMAAARGGSIVNIASVAGTIGFYSPSYGASKWGLIGLTKSAAGEWAHEGVRVNAVLPGPVDTPLLAGAEPLITSTIESVPAGRIAHPEDVAHAVRFLLSEEAAYINGTELVVDGGMTSSGLYRRILAGIHRPTGTDDD